METVAVVATCVSRNVRIIKTGTAGPVYRDSRSAGCTDRVTLHCIIHRQALRGEFLNLSRVTDLGLPTLNFVGEVRAIAN